MTIERITGEIDWPSAPRKELDSLIGWFGRYRSCAVAFSGGVDSSLLAYAARAAIVDGAVAVFSKSPATPSSEARNARQIASEIGIELLVVEQNDLASPGYVANSANRCYFCRSNLASAMEPIIKERCIEVSVDGTHADDMKSPRPGVKALREAGFKAPFVELGIGKEEIRQIARYAGLSNSDRPSEACLSSRIAFGQRVDDVTLHMVEQAELAVREITHASTIRVRVIGGDALVEVDPGCVATALENRAVIESALARVGFANVRIAEDGYLPGRMLELFAKTERT